MSWVITPSFYGYIADADAKDYLSRVHAAEGQTLEPAVALAVEAFVVGCKADGIWPAIKASCILAGARTLAGALVPLVGAAPTNNNFVSGDYNRETGLVGDGSTKYLNSNRTANADPQNNFHLSVYKTSAVVDASAFIGSVTSPFDLIDNFIGTLRCFSRNDSAIPGSINMTGVTGFMGSSRASSSQATMRGNSTSLLGNSSSSAPSSAFLHVFARSNNNVPQAYSSVRLAFYSIGESLDLALLDTRVTTLINALAAAIP
jgi:hypothetical protein